jgi:predicted RNA binding protein YcfA (HicA-like mRNA interferase family)
MNPRILSEPQPDERLRLFPPKRRTSYHEFVPVRVRDLIRKLEDAGWRHVRTSGDHRVFQDREGRITVVSGQLGDDVRPGTYRAVLRQTGIKEAEK